ncbi:inositol monophosphatase [Micromonospora sp. KC207]|uniref:Inositol monophosphatase n=1 Tax=Micromonospora carbonacea TaxID=47853 RepID=A0A7D6GS66_9ACTN|nr:MULTISPECIES: inositol monophosphatase [unclassified Micromonospora]EEP71856.1 inositol monophosphatase [Micromonospora sp. ATCC 39149]QLK01691.1 inositol monophosphatase [Micromonospora carbonacea]TDC61422.1 inositol monophosphatase [Micromonospora sp. KC207]
MTDTLADDVAELLHRAATDVVLPLFQTLDDADVTEKAPGELVTVADRRAEELISAGLRRLRPGSVVVGEEAVADDPALLGHLRGGGDVWLVDPVDGTANFAAGKRPFALMVALLTDGEQVGAWVLDPLAGTLAVARAGRGTAVNGDPVRTAEEAPPLGALRGTAMTQFLPPEHRRRAEAGGERIGELLPGQHCAGREYLDLLVGAQEFVLFWRTLPWDHAPGVLLVREAGGVARRFDGGEYHPADQGPGLLVAANEQVWAEAREALIHG